MANNIKNSKINIKMVEGIYKKMATDENLATC